ncbi:MAG: carbohydrate porin [Microbacter sp.]
MHGLVYSVILLFVFFNLNVIFAQQHALSSFNVHFQYTGDLAGNVSGGIHRGFDYLGLANLTMLFDMENAGAWKGGSFFVNIADTHGAMPSNTMIGDFQGVTNIEAGNHLMLYECWYQQKIGATSMTIGVQDLNVSFMTNDAGSSFINSSFALPPSFSANFPAPIFPHTAFGLMIQTQIPNTSLQWNGAMFDGTVEECNQSLHPFSRIFTKQNGWLAITELLDNHSLLPHRSGKYTMGFSLRHAKDSLMNSVVNFQGYAVMNQEIYHKEFQQLITFSQIGYAPMKMNDAPFFVSAGVVLKGVNHRRKNDELGCGVAYVRLRNRSFKAETALEGYSAVSISSKFILKPDLQYIIHPSRTELKLSNALLGMVRVQLKL